MTDVETLFFIKRNLISFGNKLLTKDMLMYKLDAGTSTSEAGTSEAGTSEAGTSEAGTDSNIIVESIRNSTQPQEYDTIIRDITLRLVNECAHEWVEDDIEISDERTMNIKYCCNCEINYDDLGK